MDTISRLSSFGVWASHLGLLPIGTARQLAADIEALGYSALWVGEAESREALTHAGLLLAATSRVVVATGIANIWARDAMAMVNGARTLAEAYPGRFLLGIGASHAPLLDRRGQAYARPYSAMVDYLDAMEVAPWRGPAVPEAPPVVLAALGPRMLALARVRTAGAHTFLAPVEHTRRARQILGPGRLLVPEQAVVLADTRDQARQVAERHLRGYLTLPNYRRHLERLGWTAGDMDGAVSDRLFDALVAWGDPARVAEGLRAHIDAGADHVAVHPLTPSAGDLPRTELAALAPDLGLAR
ncbi:MAG TPA: TIGR03620 family F420-dependent LLM class oxidoreductase [Nitriliruptorales bacterium]|nr:TIGR03620 family F420-dependent LLM class oxidoreductase [Nitriliruptorales bacterium]